MVNKGLPNIGNVFFRKNLFVNRPNQQGSDEEFDEGVEVFVLEDFFYQSRF